MLEVPGSLPFLSVWRMPTIWADVSKSSRPRGLGTVVGSLLGGLLGSLPLCLEGCRRFWADVLKSSKPRGLGTVVGSLLGGLLGSLPL